RSRCVAGHGRVDRFPVRHRLARRLFRLGERIDGRATLTQPGAGTPASGPFPACHIAKEAVAFRRQGTAWEQPFADTDEKDTLFGAPSSKLPSSRYGRGA